MKNEKRKTKPEKRKTKNEKTKKRKKHTPHLHQELPAQVAARRDDEGLGERATARDKKTGGTLLPQNPARAVLSQLLADKLFERFGAGHEQLRKSEQSETRRWGQESTVKGG